MKKGVEHLGMTPINLETLSVYERAMGTGRKCRLFASAEPTTLTASGQLR